MYNSLRGRHERYINSRTFINSLTIACFALTFSDINRDPNAASLHIPLKIVEPVEFELGLERQYCDKHWHEHYSHSVEQLDHCVQCWPGSVLVRVAYQIAHDCDCVSFCLFLALHLNVLLSVVPRASTVCQVVCKEQAAYNSPHEHSCHCGRPKQHSGNDRRGNCNDCRLPQLFEACASGNVDAPCIVRRVCAIHNAGLFLELSSNLVHHLGCRPADAADKLARDKERNEAADEQADYKPDV